MKKGRKTKINLGNHLMQSARCSPLDELPHAVPQVGPKGEKKLLKQEDVRHHNVPRYPEFTVEKVYQAFYEGPCGAYYPDIVAKQKRLDRNFVFDVVYTF